MKVNPSTTANTGAVTAAQTKKSDKAGLSKAGSEKGAISELDLASSSKIELSPKAKEIKKATEIAKQGPDIDEAKVAKFQALIDSGKYKVDADAVAEKMLSEHIMNAASEERGN